MTMGDAIIHHMEHREWLEELIGSDSYRTAAAKIGINQSTITKQLGRNGISPEVVIALSRAYGRKAGDELVATGYLQQSDLEGVGVEAALDLATNMQILEQVDKRMAAGAGSVFAEPIGTVDNADDLTAADQPGRLDVDVLAGVTQEDYDLAAGFPCGEHDDDEDDFELEFP